MKTALSKLPAWHDKTDAILGLGGKEIQLRWEDGTERQTRLLIELCPHDDRKASLSQ